jgi:carbon storage regulator
MRPIMLIVTVKVGEKVLIGENISVIVVENRGAQIRLGIEAPENVLVLREKLVARGKEDH